jgi:hypothetical protein
MSVDTLALTSQSDSPSGNVYVIVDDASSFVFHHLLCVSDLVMMTGKAEVLMMIISKGFRSILKKNLVLLRGFQCSPRSSLTYEHHP